MLHLTVVTCKLLVQVIISEHHTVYLKQILVVTSLTYYCCLLSHLLLTLICCDCLLKELQRTQITSLFESQVTEVIPAMVIAVLV